MRLISGIPEVQSETPQTQISSANRQWYRESTISFIDYSTVIRDLLINFIGLYFSAYVILYRKYHNTEMFVSCALFNIFVLLIVMSIIRTDFNLAVGFGLFALLSLIQVRSAQFTKTETAYVSGAIAMAVS